MFNIKIIVQYDGTDFCGWQIQPNLRTIQGEIYKAVQKIYSKKITIYGCGRTDAGVHALGQVANFRIPKMLVPIEKQLSNMLTFFEVSKKTSIKKIIKGLDKFTEMYGAIKPEVITNSKNQYDDSWAKEIKNYDKIFVCGEAKDYCVYETVKQFCEMYKSERNITEKIYFMQNCCSSIGDKDICDKKYKELEDIYGIKLITV